MSQHKSGALNKHEKQYVALNRSGNATEIANALGRAPKQVMAYILKLAQENPATTTAAELKVGDPTAARAALHSTRAWKRLTQEFEKDELEYFEEQFLALMSQFKDDVMATEENQIFKAVKLDIWMSRNAVKQRKANREIERLEKAQADLIARFKDPAAMQKDESASLSLSLLENSLQTAHAAHNSLTNEQVRLEEKHQKLMDALKGTRQQRIDKIETGKVDFLSVIRTLSEQDAKDEGGRYIELMRRATAGETRRLATPMKYADGVIDQPLLSPESVAMLDSGEVTMPDFRAKPAVQPDKEVANPEPE